MPRCVSRRAFGVPLAINHPLLHHCRPTWTSLSNCRNAIWALPRFVQNRVFEFSLLINHLLNRWLPSVQPARFTLWRVVRKSRTDRTPVRFSETVFASFRNPRPTTMPFPIDAVSYASLVHSAVHIMIIFSTLTNRRQRTANGFQPQQIHSVRRLSKNHRPLQLLRSPMTLRSKIFSSRPT